MPSLPEVGAEVYLDIDRYENSINQAISLADDLDARLGNIAEQDISISVDATVDADEAEGLVSDLESFDGSTYEASAEAVTESADFDALDEEIIGFDSLESEGTATALTEGEDDVTNLEGDLVAIEGDHEGTAKVDVEETPAAHATLGFLNSLAAGAIVFTAVINVAGTILDAIRAVESLTITPFLDVDQASAEFAAHTGEAADSVEDIIFRIHQADLGDFNDIESVLEVGRSIGLTGDALEDAATQALNFTKVFDDQNAGDVISQINRMIELGLVDTFQEGADTLTVAFQQGGNRAGDLLQTLEMYGPMFSAMGLNAQEAMALLNEGLRGGYRNTSDFARQIATMQDNVIAASADTSSAAAEAFDNIGVDLPAQGEEMGAEFVQNVIDGINSLPPGAGRDAAISAIFGRRAGGTEAILSVDIGASFEPIEGGEAEQAAAVLDDHLRGTFDDIGLQIETIAHDFLSSEQIDLPGKMAAIKDALQIALQEVAQGATLGEALQSGLDQVLGDQFDFAGLEQAISKFEGAVGNIAIILSQAVSAILDLVGQDALADQMRAGISDMALDQLTFDIQAEDLNTQGLTDAVNIALQRGVSEVDILPAIDQAFAESLASGDIVSAQAIIDAMSGIFGPDFTAAMQTELDKAAAALVVPPLPLAANPEQAYGVQITPPAIAPAVEADMAAVTTAVDSTTQSVILNSEQLGSSIQGADEVIHEAVIGGSIVPDLRSVGTTAQTSFPLVGIAAAAMAFAMLANGAIVNMVAFQIVNAFNAIEVGSHALLDAATRATILTGALTGLGNTFGVLDNLASKLANINSSARNAMAAVQAVGNAGGNVTNNNTNVNVTQNNNVQNNAQAASVSQQTANAVRGF